MTGGVGTVATTIVAVLMAWLLFPALKIFLPTQISHAIS
jgi:hypothetical protein